MAHTKESELLGCVVTDDTLVLLGSLSFVLVPTALAVFTVT